MLRLLAPAARSTRSRAPSSGAVALVSLLAAVAGCASPDLGRASEPGGRVRALRPTGAPDAGPGEVDGGGGATDAPAAMPSVAWEAPADGASFVRSVIEGSEWVAPVTLRVRATGVDHVDFVADGTFALGTALAAPWEVRHGFTGDGTRVLSAIGRAADGTELARDEIAITVAPPPDTGCHAMLDALGLDWAVAGATRGIADPVRVQPIIHGVAFRYVSNATPTAMLMDCELAPRLAALADLVTAYGIDEVIHIGIYNYRCIGGGDPDVDGCTPSMHAYARAIDLHAFGLAGSDVEYSTEDDFVITTRADPCPIASFSEPDRVLKAIACALWSERIFQIVLTPNYNAAHRNHYHVDLTAGSMYIGAGVEGVDPAVGGLGD